MKVADQSGIGEGHIVGQHDRSPATISRPPLGGGAQELASGCLP